MAKDYSFDVVCRTDLQEAANAVNQASKEIGTRYDFKGSKSSVSFDGSLITLIGDDDFKLRLVREIVNGKLVKRGISLKNIEEKKKEKEHRQKELENEDLSQYKISDKEYKEKRKQKEVDRNELIALIKQIATLK